MKKILLFALLYLGLSNIISAQTKLDIDDAAKHIGETITICSKVFSARYLDQSNGAPTLINLGAAYPDQKLTVVVFGTDRANFKGKPEEDWKDKTICVTGKISEYHGKPQIVITKPEQVVVQ